VLGPKDHHPELRSRGFCRRVAKFVQDVADPLTKTQAGGI
jgi:hypothetical protein